MGPFFEESQAKPLFLSSDDPNMGGVQDLLEFKPLGLGYYNMLGISRLARAAQAGACGVKPHN